jgi:capsular exopolysaccharide synthesis family protein
MESERDAHVLQVKHLSKQSGRLASTDMDDFAELKKKGLNFRPLVRLIRRNLFLIADVAFLVAVAMVYSSMKTPRTYEGDFQLLVEPITNEAKLSDPSVIARDGQSNTTTGMDYPTLLQVLQSPELLSKATKRIQSRSPNFPSNGLTKALSTKSLLVQRLGTNMLDSAKIITVHYQGSSPETTRIVLEELASEYLRYSLEARKTRISGGVKFIEAQLPGLQQRVDDLQEELQMLQQRYRLSNPTSEGETLAKQAHEIENLRADTQRDLQEQGALYANLRNQLGLAPTEALAASTLSQDPRYQDLLSQLEKIESQIAVKSARFSEESPVVEALREQQKNLSLLLRQEAQKILGQNLSSQTATPQVLAFQDPLRLELIKQMVETVNKGQTLAVRNQAILQTQAIVNQRVTQFPTIIRQYNDLQRQLELSTKTLNQFLLQRDTLRIEAAQKEVPWELISEPKLMQDAAGNPMPSGRGTGKKLGIGVIAGLLLGIGLAALKDKFRNVFFSTEDIQDAIELPVLGVIPFDNRRNYFLNAGAMVASLETTRVEPANVSLFQEAFNSLYASFCFLTANSPVRSLVVSSAAPGDGKTTIALHLAQVAAILGQRVLLVDANLRLPQLHTQLGLPNSQGLCDLLAQNLPPDDFIQRSSLEDTLFVLTAGHLLPDSTRLLASARMQHLMEQFQAAFDLVIYDTPHLLGLADTNFLAAQSDGILMVVGVGKTNRSVVMQVLNGLNEFRLPILGVVANHVKQGTNSSYGYYKHHYNPGHPTQPTLIKKLKKFNPGFLATVNRKDAP